MKFAGPPTLCSKTFVFDELLQRVDRPQETAAVRDGRRGEALRAEHVARGEHAGLVEPKTFSRSPHHGIQARRCRCVTKLRAGAVCSYFRAKRREMLAR
jgi:hypothetical protein